MNQVSPIVTTFSCFFCTCYLHTKEIITKNTYIMNSIYYMMVTTVDKINYTTGVRVVDID